VELLMDFSMDNALWEEYFDLIIAKDRGSLFFKSEDTFWERDPYLGPLKNGEKIDNVDDFRHYIILDKIFLEGNSKLLTKYF
jgi:hypothetical protein